MFCVAMGPICWQLSQTRASHPGTQQVRDVRTLAQAGSLLWTNTRASGPALLKLLPLWLVAVARLSSLPHPATEAPPCCKLLAKSCAVATRPLLAPTQDYLRCRFACGKRPVRVANCTLVIGEPKPLRSLTPLNDLTLHVLDDIGYGGHVVCVSSVQAGLLLEGSFALAL